MSNESPRKQEVTVSFNEEDDCPLSAQKAVLSTDPSNSFHESRGMRSPLGIYNTSTSRLFSRVARYCTDIEPLFKEAKVSRLHATSDHQEKITDSFEAMLYAAAEHVDDVENLASGFFKTHPLAKRDGRFRKLSNQIDKSKKVTSTIANKIKHEQARVRLFALEILHGDTPASLHGFIIEGANGGTIGPHQAIHAVNPVLSLTTIAWEALEFAVAASTALSRFLAHFPKLEHDPQKMQCAPFVEAVKSAARLPTYTFGEQHPFARTTFRLTGRENTRSGLDSGLYGSISKRWSSSQNMQYGSFMMSSRGDGSSKSFALPKPSKVAIVHWS